MGEAIYHVMVIAVALVGLFRGYHAGLLRQVPAVLGFVFGIVAARSLGLDFAKWLGGWFPKFYAPVAEDFFLSVLAYGMIWSLTLWILSSLTSILGRILSVIPAGIVNSLAGAVFSFVKYLTFLSLLFDLALCRPAESPLMHCARHDDGNLVDCVIRLAPQLLGTLSADEYIHQVQLWEAKSIS